MTSQNLKEYLKIVLDMEANVYYQQELIEKLKTDLSALESKNRYLTAPDEPAQPIKESADIGANIAIALSMIIIPALLLVWAGYLFKHNHGFFGTIIGGFGGFYLLAMIIAIWSGASDDAKINKRKQAEYERRSKLYPEQMEKYRSELNQYEIDKKTLPSKIQYYKTMLSQMEYTHSRTKERLQKFYDYDIIYFKWRGFVNASNLYDYIASGMCSKLEGPHGAYEQLMQDIRTNKVITSISQAKQQLAGMLGDIYAGQSMIVQELRNLNNRMDGMSDNINRGISKLDNASNINTNLLQQIQNNSAVAVYQSERTSKELQYANRMNYLAGNYNNVFYNIPPT